MEVGVFSRWLKFVPLALAVLGLAVWYDTHCYRGFSAPEAMDAAQVARNLADGRGFSTDFIRPFSIYLVQNHNQQTHANEMSLTNVVDFAQLNSPHPDLANAPVYPTLLAGLFKLLPPSWQTESDKPFWSKSGHYQRYKPEFQIALLNQILLLVVVILTFVIARHLFDNQVAWLAALLTLGCDALWTFSVSGLSTMLLLVIFLALIFCLIKLEQAGREPVPQTTKLFALAIIVGMLTGLGMLTRYSFGWLIVPVVAYQLLFGGIRRPWLATATFAAFALVVTPWIIRNLSVSGTLFGTAGYSILEGTGVFPGSQLMQSIDPDVTKAFGLRPFTRKFLDNINAIFQGDLLRLAGGWVSVLFFAGLLLGLRNLAARRLRYFTLMSLLMLTVVQAMGRTWLSDQSAEINSENLLVLLTPLVVIFGVVFFLTLLNQIKFAAPQLRVVVIILVAVIASLPLLASLLPPRKSPVIWPPYYPPEIQKIAGWMRPDELVMSDIPWAMAWYGDRQCVWTTTDANQDFYKINDYIKPVRGLFLSYNTLNSKLISECELGGNDSWGRFVLNATMFHQLPKGFPLRFFPEKSISFGLFYTDRIRWKT